MTINAVVLIAIAVIIALALIGLYRGFVKTIYHLCSAIIVFILAFALKNPMTTLLSGNATIYGFVQTKVESLVDLPFETRDQVVEMIESKSLPEAIKNLAVKLLDSFLDSESMSITSFRATIYMKVTDIVMGIIGFIIALIIAFIAVAIVFKLLDMISNLPVFCHFNRIGGFLVGLAEGIVTVWIMCGIVSALSLIGFCEAIVAQIHENVFLSFMYDHSFVGTLLSGNFLDALSDIGDLGAIRDGLSSLIG